MNSMVKPYNRKDGRTQAELRPVFFSRGVYDFAAGSILFEMGKTKVLCAVSIQNGVPPFLRGKGIGWLTAEYALLPMSTATRTQRDGSLGRKDGRSVEIARFIGRCFRSVVDLSLFGEKTITVDCDVLQADGGTRTASITGAFLALSMAQDKWLAQRLIDRPLIKEKIAAVSVGVVQGTTLLDLNYEEDSAASADFNFVITESDKIIEMQGGAESSPLSWELFDDVRNVARDGAKKLFERCRQELPAKKTVDNVTNNRNNQTEHIPLFSLKNRQNSSQ